MLHVVGLMYDILMRRSLHGLRTCQAVVGIWILVSCGLGWFGPFWYREAVGAGAY